MVVAFKETEKWGKDNFLVNKSWISSPQHLPFYITQGGERAELFLKKLMSKQRHLIQYYIYIYKYIRTVYKI